MATIPEVKAKAIKLVKEGRYEQAIKLYEKIISALSKKNRPDYSLYNTIGDIYANNIKNKDLAIENYRTAMQFYGDNELFPNAIAMAKKIVKIDPEQIDMYEKIGEYNKKQGLIGEAINNYILFSEKCLKKNDTAGAIRAFKEVLQMMPDKVEFKERLVDLYIKEDQIEQAIELLKETESYYIKMNAMDQASAVRNKIKQLSAKLPKTQEVEVQPEPEIIEKSPVIEEEAVEDIDMGNLLGDLSKELDETFSNIGEEEAYKEHTETVFDSQTHSTENVIPTNTESVEETLSTGLDYESFVELGKLQEEMDPQEAIQSYYQGAEGYFSIGDLENSLRVYNMILKVKPNEIKALKAIVDIGKKLNKTEYIVNADIKLAEIFFSTMPQDALQTINEALQYAPDNMQAMQVKMKILNILNPQQSQQTQVKEQKAEPVIQEPVQQPKPEPQPQPEQKPEVVNPIQAETQEQSNSELDFLNEFKSEITEDIENLDFLNDTKEQVTAKDILSGKNEGGKPKFKVEESEQSGSGDVWSLSELLDELKEGLEENIDEGDVSSHYELGMSFKEMGLFDMAIAEFEKSMKSKQYEMQSLEMLGQCYLEMNKLDLAENTLIKAMSISGKKPEEYLGIKFSLAILYEKKKMYKEALKLLKEIQAIKPDFENIEKHIKLVSDTVSGQAPEPIKKAEKTEEFIDFAELINEEEFDLDNLDNIDDIEVEFDDEDESNKNKNKKNISYM